MKHPSFHAVIVSLGCALGLVLGSCSKPAPRTKPAPRSEPAPRSAPAPRSEPAPRRVAKAPRAQPTPRHVTKARRAARPAARAAMSRGVGSLRRGGAAYRRRLQSLTDLDHMPENPGGVPVSTHCTHCTHCPGAPRDAGVTSP